MLYVAIWYVSIRPVVVRVPQYRTVKLALITPLVQRT